MGERFIKKAVFLDRDGVLNKVILKAGKPYAPQSLQDLVIKEDAFIYLPRLKAVGYLLIVVTNQPDVARGTMDELTVMTINRTLIENLPLDDVFTCYHDDINHCNCRKPLPGLLLKAAEAHNISLQQSFMIGDRWRDIDAGKQAGCKTIWLNFNYSEKQPTGADFETTTLREAVHWITNR